MQKSPGGASTVSMLACNTLAKHRPAPAGDVISQVCLGCVTHVLYPGGALKVHYVTFN